jgi:hypothetical protein
VVSAKLAASPNRLSEIASRRTNAPLPGTSQAIAATYREMTLGRHRGYGSVNSDQWNCSSSVEPFSARVSASGSIAVATASK